ncbi:LysM domain-containing protein, partial [Trinickia fusca]
MADITYDELNRVAEVDSPGVKINYEYDANGNRRRVLSAYTDINGAPQVQDYWYKYDSQNRFVLTMGAKGMGLGASGAAITYDAAGERSGAAYADGHTESYAYNADGYLTDVYISKDGKDADKVLRAHRVSDALGRVTEYFEYADDGKTITKDDTSVFDDDNRLTKDTQVLAPAGQKSHTVTLTYDYRLDDGHGNYTGADQGVVTHTQQHDTASPSVIDTATGYVWWDQAEQSTIQVRGSDPTNPNAWRWGTGMSEFRYDVNGHLRQVVAHGTDNQGRLVSDPSIDRTTTYTNDAHGQVLQRDDGAGGALTLTERYYYLDGNRIGEVSNNGPATVSYAEELAQADRLKAFGQFRYGLPVTSADFDQNYQPINAEYPGKSPLRYTVHDGDTLSTIARALWGDASLWYLIADANGLTSDNHLSAGQVLSIPNKVTNFHNSASTFKVYNPGEAIGDAMPTLPPEPMPPPPPMP